MKQLFLTAVLTLTAATAFASKARKMALQGSETISADIQDIFERPNRMNALPDLATFEFGGTATVYATQGTTSFNNGLLGYNSPNAEGGVLRTWGDHKLGIYIGRQSETVAYLASGGQGISIPYGSTTSALGTAFGSTSARLLDNPLTLAYATKFGDLSFGANLYYASSNKQSAVGTDQPTTKSAQGLAVGLNGDVWEAYVNLGLGASIKSNVTGSSETMKATSSYKLGGGYYFGDLYAYGRINSFGGNHESSAGTEDSKLTVSGFALGVEHKVKSEAAAFFYGISYQTTSEAQGSSNSAQNGAKIDTTVLPLIIGVEADANSWLALRASIVQPVLIATQKNTPATASTATATTDTLLDKTTVRAGASFKFDKLHADFMLAAANPGYQSNTTNTAGTGTSTTTTNTGGQLNMTNFGTNASLTYTF